MEEMSSTAPETLQMRLALSSYGLSGCEKKSSSKHGIGYEGIITHPAFLRVRVRCPTMARDETVNTLSTYVSFSFIGSQMYPALCIEYFNTPPSSSRL
ncbi:hypothetical protein TNCV_3915571 [Trichonephila clavipes]|nr:hypothetical protein TNCV_3915571 [Trichonephila clavipes]